MGLTRIKLQRAIYFCVHRGKSPLKGCKMASLDAVLKIPISIASSLGLLARCSQTLRTSRRFRREVRRMIIWQCEGRFLSAPALHLPTPRPTGQVEQPTTGICLALVPAPSVVSAVCL